MLRKFSPHSLPPSGKSPRAHVTQKRLGLFNTHVWLQHHMRQVVGNAPRTLALEAPMERQANLVDQPPIHIEWANSLGHHSPRFDFATGRADDDPLSMLDLPF